MQVLTRIRTFLVKRIWQTDLSAVGKRRRHAIRLLRSFVIAFREFDRDNCPLKASALTYYTLLSIVPVIALLFGIARGFGLEQRLEAQLRADISYNQRAIEYILELATNLVETTSGGLIAGLGMVFLVWAVIKLVGQIEQALNDVFEVASGRTMLRKFTDYLSIALVAPVLIILTGSVTVIISSGASTLFSGIGIWGVLGPVVGFFTSLIPLFTTALLFAVSYVLLPNTRVKLSSALFGAFFAALATTLVSWIYLRFQIGVSRYNAIYGGLAALPLFLVFVHTNWLILLLGAELSHGYQNHGGYELVIDTSRISNSARLLLSVFVIKRIVDAFQRDEPSPAAQDLADELHVPAKLIRWLLQELVNARLISPLAAESPESGSYQPAVTLERLDVNMVRGRLGAMGIDDISTKPSALLERAEAALAEIEKAVAASPGNVLLRDL